MDNKKRIVITGAGMEMASLQALAKTVQDAEIVQVGKAKVEPPKLEPAIPSGVVIGEKLKGMDHGGPHEYRYRGGEWACRWCGQILGK